MKELIIAVLITLAVSLVIAAGVRSLDKHGCENYGDITDREVMYSYTTCYVKTDRGLSPVKNLILEQRHMNRTKAP